MTRNFFITLAFLALASAGWFFASKQVPAAREEGSVAALPIISQARPPTVGDTGHDRVSTREAISTNQSRDPSSESVGSQEVSSPPPMTARISQAPRLSSPPVKNSPSSRPLRTISAASPTRPTPVSNERTRSKSSFATAHQNRARQESNAPQPSQPPISSVRPERVKPQNPEIEKPSKIPAEDIASVDPAGVPASEKTAEDQVVTTPVAPQPAVWVDLGAASSLSQDKQEEIQGLAESLSRKISESGLDPASPEYKQVWNEAVADSDQLFRQRYGNQAWMEHHIQAHHLAHPTGK